MCTGHLLLVYILLLNSIYLFYTQKRDSLACKNFDCYKMIFSLSAFSSQLWFPGSSHGIIFYVWLFEWPCVHTDALE